MKDLSQLLSIAIAASLKAGIAIMDVYESDNFDVEIKGDDSPLTSADIKANEIINSFLIPTEIPIISEENKQTDFAVRENWKTCWIVDPVDGTKEFIKRNGEFTVNIALIENGKPVLGVIYVPVTKTLYFGNVIDGKGCRVNLDSHDTSMEEVLKNSIPLNPKKKETEKIQVVGSRSHMNQETIDFIDEIKEEGIEVEVVSKGSSLKFCLIADGKADVYPRYAPTMEWDTAAGQAICEAVNIKVISLQNNKPMRYNKENLLNPWFICK